MDIPEPHSLTRWPHLNLLRHFRVYTDRPSTKYLKWTSSESFLMYGIMRGTLQTIKMAVHNNIGSVDSKTRCGDTALCVACDLGRSEVVKYLLNIGANPSTQDAKKRTPLHYARVSENHHDILIDLVQAGADIDADDFKLGTPLHYACTRGELRKIDALLRLGAKINLTNIGGATPLHCACSVGRIDVVQRLLEAGADIELRTEQWLTPLHVAVYNGWIHIVKLLLQHGALIYGLDLDGKGSVTILHMACCIRKRNKQPSEPEAVSSVSMLEFLLDSCADDAVNVLDARGATLLHYAVRNLDPSAVSLLILRGVDINKTDWKHLSALHYLVTNGYRCSMQYDAYFEHDKCYKPLVEIIRLLLENGIRLPQYLYPNSSDSVMSIEDEEVGLYDISSSDSDGPDVDNSCDLMAFNKHPCLLMFLYEAGISGHLIYDDLSSDIIDAKVRELRILSKWYRWQVNAGIATDRSIAGKIMNRINHHLSSLHVDASNSRDNHQVHDNSAGTDSDNDVLIDNEGDDDDDDIDIDVIVRERRRVRLLKVCQTVMEDATHIQKVLSNPRTLEHLSRMTIRSQLIYVSSGCSIFPLIECLPVPKTIKGFIRLDDIHT